MSLFTKCRLILGITLALAMFLVAVLHNGDGISHAKSPHPAVTGLTLTPGPLSIAVSWDPLPNPPAWYDVVRFRVIGGEKTDGENRNITTTSITFQVPIADIYTVSVAACDNSGACGPAVTAQVDVTGTGAPRPTDKPSKPTGYTLTVQPNTLTVSASWDESSEAEHYNLKWRLPKEGFDRNSKIKRLISNQVDFSVSSGATWVVRLDACNSLGCRHSTKRIEVPQPIQIKPRYILPEPENFALVPSSRAVPQGDWEYEFRFEIPAHRDSGAVLTNSVICVESFDPAWQAAYDIHCETYDHTLEDYQNYRTLTVIPKNFDRGPLVPNTEYDASVRLIGADNVASGPTWTTFTIGDNGNRGGRNGGGNRQPAMSVELVGLRGVEVNWENLAIAGFGLAAGAEVCLDMVEDPDREWRGPVCELVTDASSKTYTFGEWPLIFNREYKASVQLFEGEGYIGEPVTKTFTFPGMTVFTPMAVKPPTHVGVTHDKSDSDIVIVFWGSTDASPGATNAGSGGATNAGSDSATNADDENIEALTPEGWQVCWDGSCVDQSASLHYRHYENPVISSGGVVTVQGIATYNGARVLSAPVSWTAPTVAAAKNLRIAHHTNGAMVVQWDSAYRENGEALKPEGWQVCPGDSCFDTSADDNPVGVYDNPVRGTTLTVQGLATSDGIRIESAPVSIVVPDRGATNAD